jgi:hypothetical protein
VTGSKLPTVQQLQFFLPESVWEPGLVTDRRLSCCWRIYRDAAGFDPRFGLTTRSIIVALVRRLTARLMIAPRRLERPSMTVQPRFTKPRCRPACWSPGAMTPIHSAMEELVLVVRPEFAVAALDRHVAVGPVGGDVVGDAAGGAGRDEAVLAGRAGNRLL